MVLVGTQLKVMAQSRTALVAGVQNGAEAGALAGFLEVARVLRDFEKIPEKVFQNLREERAKLGNDIKRVAAKRDQADHHPTETTQIPTHFPHISYTCTATHIMRRTSEEDPQAFAHPPWWMFF